MFHTSGPVTDRQDFQRVLNELLPYLEILSGDILLVKGEPLLAHDGEAALIMIFPKSVVGQNLFFVERITLETFGGEDKTPFPPLYLSRNFADDGDLLGELEGMLPARSVEAISSSFHHLLWTQLKVLDLFAEGSLKKITAVEIRKHLQQHRDFLSPFFKEMPDPSTVLEKSWAPGRAIHIQIEKKRNLLNIDFSKTQWPKEWAMSGDFLKDLVPQVLRHHLYPDLSGTDAENDFFKLTLPLPLENPRHDGSVPQAILAPLICDLLSEALHPYFAESGWASGGFGPLYFQLEFSSGTQFRHLLFGGGGARPFSHGETSYNPWLPGSETMSYQRSLVALPLQVLKLGKREGSGGKGQSQGGDGVEWIFKLKEKAFLTAYTFQGLWPARGMKTQNSGKKAQILVGEDDVLGRKIQIKEDLPAGTVLSLQTAGGAGLG